MTPSLDAQAHSQKLLQHLKKTLDDHGGKISFHDYMKIALYEPALGYYSAGAHKLGEAGDFITAPEISPLFGMTIAKSLMPLAAKQWFELGAGTGKLAESILCYLATQNVLPENYFILEVSADLKQRQKIYLKQQLPSEVFARIIWLDTLPQHFSGIMLANEVLDALPVHRFKMTEEGAKEIFVGEDIETLEEPSSAELKQRIEALGLPMGYESEINLQQEALVKSLSESLSEGVLLFMDYGFPAREYYHPDRNRGTLMCHYQHYAHENPYLWPGLQDITAHVDFTALARCGIESGLMLMAYTTQEAWLLHHGILDFATKLTSPSPTARREPLQKLISPAEMGELFKVILFGKNLKADLSFVTPMDRRHAL